jgi:hypothetical protein
MIRPKDPPLVSGTQFSAIVILTIILFLIIDLGRRTTAGYYVSQAEKDLMAAIRAETEIMQQQLERLAYVQTDAFVEEWARERAHMVREGDRPLIVVTSTEPSEKPQAVLPSDTTSPNEPAPNWHQWWRLFFNSAPGTFRR